MGRCALIWAEGWSLCKIATKRTHKGQKIYSTQNKTWFIWCLQNLRYWRVSQKSAEQIKNKTKTKNTIKNKQQQQKNIQGSCSISTIIFFVFDQISPGHHKVTPVPSELLDTFKTCCGCTASEVTHRRGEGRLVSASFCSRYLAKGQIKYAWTYLRVHNTTYCAVRWSHAGTNVVWTIVSQHFLNVFY